MNQLSIGHAHWFHLFWLRSLYPNHHCCQLLQSDVWTLLTSLTSKSKSATASQSTITSARKPQNRSSLSESLKRSILKTSNAFLRLNFQKLTHFCFVDKDNAKWRKGSSGSLVLLLFTRFSWDCTAISVYRSSEVYRSRPDVLGGFALNRVINFDFFHELEVRARRLPSQSVCWMIMDIHIFFCAGHTFYPIPVTATKPEAKQQLLYFFTVLACHYVWKTLFYFGQCKSDLGYPNQHSDVLFFSFQKPCHDWKSVKSALKLVVNHTDSSAVTDHQTQPWLFRCNKAFLLPNTPFYDYGATQLSHKQYLAVKTYH